MAAFGIDVHHVVPPLLKTNIEFWQNKFSKNIERDKRKIKELQSLGWQVLTIWECEIKKDLDTQITKIKRFL